MWEPITLTKTIDEVVVDLALGYIHLTEISRDHRLYMQYDTTVNMYIQDFSRDEKHRNYLIDLYKNTKSQSR